MISNPNMDLEGRKNKQTHWLIQITGGLGWGRGAHWVCPHAVCLIYLSHFFSFNTVALNTVSTGEETFNKERVELWVKMNPKHLTATESCRPSFFFTHFRHFLFVSPFKHVTGNITGFVNLLKWFLSFTHGLLLCQFLSLTHYTHDPGYES